MLFNGLILLSEYVRRRHSRWHRWLGRVQVVVLLLLVLPSSLVMSGQAFGGWPAGLSSLAVRDDRDCAIVGVVQACRKRFDRHRRWMLRCYVLICSAVVLRLISGTAGWSACRVPSTPTFSRPGAAGCSLGGLRNRGGAGRHKGRLNLPPVRRHECLVAVEREPPLSDPFCRLINNLVLPKAITEEKTVCMCPFQGSISKRRRFLLHWRHTLAQGQFNLVLRFLRRVVRDAGVPDVTDADLIARYARTGDQAAFELILRRHGAMVLRVCRDVTGSEHDSEDAFQATFLALARKAASIKNRESLSAWLYRIAYRAALRARRHRVRTNNRIDKKYGVNELPARSEAARRDS